MEKSMSIPLKESLIKKLSQQLNIPESTIDLVISDQFTEAFRATSNFNSIELSGFGKFVFHQKKAAAQMNKYQAQKTMLETALIRCAPEDKRNLTMRLNTTNKNIDHLKPKLR